MRFHLMHIDDRSRPFTEDEEVYLITPGAGKTALAVPLDAVPNVVALLAETLDGRPEQACEGCGEPLALAFSNGG